MMGKLIDLMMNKNFGAAVFCVAVVSALIFGAVMMPDQAGATTGKSVRSETYITDKGTIIEVVKVPDFGKCMLTSVDVICKEGRY